jgi:hypothetical protein
MVLAMLWIVFATAIELGTKSLGVPFGVVIVKKAVFNGVNASWRC